MSSQLFQGILTRPTTSLGHPQNLRFSNYKLDMYAPDLKSFVSPAIRGSKHSFD